MAERIISGYKRLFEIRLLHHYWLDEGATVFDLMPDRQQRDKRLLSYDVRSFLEVTPTSATSKILNGMGCIYKNTGLGCVVAVPDGVVIQDEPLFEFIIAARNTAFFNYTALTLGPREIYEFYYQPEKKTYRFKENIPLLSNQTGATRGAGLNKALFLSREIPVLAANDQVESLVLSGSALLQLTSDQPGADTQQIGAMATDLPVFVHQGDAPVIIPPSGLVGAPARGIMLTEDVTDQVFALIRISAIRADDQDFSCIDSSGHAKTASPVFQVRFKNRSTFWQYHDKRNGALTAAEPNPLPLTYFGNAGTKQKPSSEGPVKAVKSGTRIDRLVSEIFV